MPRHPDGRLKLLAALDALNQDSPLELSVIPTFVFSGTREDDVREMLVGIKEMGLIPEVIIMVNGANPMLPGEEDQFVEIATGILNIAKITWNYLTLGG